MTEELLEKANKIKAEIELLNALNIPEPNLDRLKITITSKSPSYDIPERYKFEVYRFWQDFRNKKISELEKEFKELK